MLKITGNLRYDGQLYPNAELQHHMHFVPMGICSVDTHIHTEGVRRNTMANQINKEDLYQQGVEIEYDAIILRLDEIIRERILQDQPELIIEIL